MYAICFGGYPPSVPLAPLRYVDDMHYLADNFERFQKLNQRRKVFLAFKFHKRQLLNCVFQKHHQQVGIISQQELYSALPISYSFR